MRTGLLPSLRAVAVFVVLTGLGYPAAVTVAARLLFPAEAAGSLITEDGRVVGSRLVGLPWHDRGHFWGRPSATVPEYNGAASAASQWGPTSPALDSAVRARVAALRAAGQTGPIPVDQVTGSGSGLDPDLSPAAALAQAERVATARGLDPARVRRLVEAHVTGRTWGILGEPRVNVLALNLALDGLTR